LGGSSQVGRAHPELGGDVWEGAVPVEVLGPQPPFVDLHPRRPARWWDRDAIALQGAPEGVLADMGFGPDGPQGASFVDNELLKSFPGELCGERVSPRRLTPGRSQPEMGRVSSYEKSHVVEADAEALGDIAWGQSLA
jgi:hypothetical protein